MWIMLEVFMWFWYRSIVIMQVSTFQMFAVLFTKFLSFSGKHNSFFQVSPCLPQCMTCVIDILITYFKWRSVTSLKKWIANITLFVITYKRDVAALNHVFTDMLFWRNLSPYKVQNTDKPHQSCSNHILHFITALTGCKFRLPIDCIWPIYLAVVQIMCAMYALAFTKEYSVFGFRSCYMTCSWNNFDLHRKVNWEKQQFNIGTAFIWSWGNTGSNSCWVMKIYVVQIFKITWLNVVPTWICWCNDGNLGNHVDIKCKVSYGDLLIQTILLEV